MLVKRKFFMIPLLILTLSLAVQSTTAQSGSLEWKISPGSFHIWIYTKFIREGEAEWEKEITTDTGETANITMKEGLVIRIEITKLGTTTASGKTQYGEYVDDTIEYSVTEKETTVTEVMKTYGNREDWETVVGTLSGYSVEDGYREGILVFSPSSDHVQKWKIVDGFMWYFYIKYQNTETEMKSITLYKEDNETISGFEAYLIIPTLFITVIVYLKKQRKL